MSETTYEQIADMGGGFFQPLNVLNVSSNSYGFAVSEKHLPAGGERNKDERRDARPRAAKASS